MRQLIDLTGKQFGRWTVVERVSDPRDKFFPYWKCVCACGQERVVRGANLRNGTTTGCGCVRPPQWGSHNPRWKGDKSQRFQTIERRVAWAVDVLRKDAPDLLAKYDDGLQEQIHSAISRQILRGCDKRDLPKHLGESVL